MLGKQDLYDAIAKDMDICIHLHSKLTAADADFRFSAGQRSNLELLQYLSCCAIGPCTFMVTGDADIFAKSGAASKSVTLASFPAVMAKQKADLKALFDGISDADFNGKAVTFPWGAAFPSIGSAILNTVFKWVTSYKMQLFLQAKVNGHPELATMNVWLGQDAPAPKK